MTQQIEHALKRCGKRVDHLEAIMERMVEAWDNSEMSNVVAALDEMRRVLLGR